MQPSQSSFKYIKILSWDDTLKFSYVTSCYINKTDITLEKAQENATFLTEKRDTLNAIATLLYKEDTGYGKNLDDMLKYYISFVEKKKHEKEQKDNNDYDTITTDECDDLEVITMEEIEKPDID